MGGPEGRPRGQRSQAPSRECAGRPSEARATPALGASLPVRGLRAPGPEPQTHDGREDTKRGPESAGGRRAIGHTHPSSRVLPCKDQGETVAARTVRRRRRRRSREATAADRSQKTSARLLRMERAMLSWSVDFCLVPWIEGVTGSSSTVSSVSLSSLSLYELHREARGVDKGKTKLVSLPARPGKIHLSSSKSVAFPNKYIAFGKNKRTFGGSRCSSWCT